MQIISLVGGPVATNAYLIVDPTAGAAIAIDAPQGTAAALVAAAAQHGATIGQLINTHGHWDHIADNAALQRQTGATIAIHAADADLLRQPDALLPTPFVIPPTEPDRLLAEGDQVRCGSYTFVVFHTPGHAPGAICLYAAEQGLLIAGDTLFRGGHGNLQLPRTDAAAMQRSLARLAQLPPTVQVLAGHGEPTTIGAELPWLRALVLT